MALYNWETWTGTNWKDVGSNTLVFSGSSTDLTIAVNVDAYNTGVHLGTNDPGSDQCGSTHVPCITFVSDTVFSKDGGNSTTTITDTAFASTLATFRVKFTDDAGVAISSGRIFTFNGIDEATPAVGVSAYALEQGVGTTSFKHINGGGLGGDNSTSRLTLSTHNTSSVHYFYVGMSAQPETPGAKSLFDIGVALVFS